MITKGEWLKLQIQAGSKARYAVKKGYIPHITKTTKCIDCGDPAYGYDHRDYHKPLSVEPVCRRCNSKRGKALPEYKEDILNKTDLRNLEDDCLELNSYGPIPFDVNQYDAHNDYLNKIDFNFDVLMGLIELRKHPKKYRKVREYESH